VTFATETKKKMCDAESWKQHVLRLVVVWLYDF